MLCDQGGKGTFYPAKIIDIKERNGEKVYKIHYKVIRLDGFVSSVLPRTFDFHSFSFVFWFVLVAFICIYFLLFFQKYNSRYDEDFSASETVTRWKDISEEQQVNMV